MRDHSTITGDQLADALNILGVNFLLGGTNGNETLPREPDRLIAELAKSSEARLRLSLIALFLERPEFAAYVRKTAQHLNKSARTTLQCYYSAAVRLQQIYRPRLNVLIGEKQSLPDHFSRELGLQMTGDPEEQLQALAGRHQVLSGERVNWLGTYHHAAQVWLKGLEIRNA